nr:unnamed protein product [Callosobruchus analis]
MARNTGPSPSPKTIFPDSHFVQCCQLYIKHKTHTLHAPFLKKIKIKMNFDLTLLTIPTIRSSACLVAL